MSGMHEPLYDWKAAIWTIILSGLIAFIIAFFFYAPAFYITLFGGAEGKWSAAEHWSRLSANLVRYYVPIGIASGIFLMFFRMFIHEEKPINAFGVLFAGILAGLAHTTFVIFADPQPWLNVFGSNLGLALVTFVNWATLPVILSILICSIVWLIRNFVGLRSL